MRYLLPYLTDRGDEVMIRVDYYSNRSNLPIDNERRLEIGGWNIDNDPRLFCEGLVLERKHFKPRKMHLLTDDEYVEFYVRSLDKYLDYLNDPEQLTEGIITHAVGESNNFVCNFIGF